MRGIHYYLKSAALLLLLASCEGMPQVDFAQPFPLSAPALRRFPARHQGPYTPPGNSTYRLIITAEAGRAAADG